MKLGLLRDIAYIEDERFKKGGPGSGNFDHEGRPGEVGGSGEGGGGGKDGGDKSKPKSPNYEGPKNLSEGDKVKINYGEHKGKMGTFVEYSPQGGFATVKVGKESVYYHISDLVAKK